jgi:hypothetical protein
VVQEGSEALRNGEHPLAHGKRRQDMIDEMGGGLDHTAGITRRTYSTTCAGERDQEVVTTTGTPSSCESVSKNAAAQIGPEVTLDPGRHAVTHGIGLGGLCQERLEVVLDQRIERRQGGTAPAVDGPAAWCGGPKGRPRWRADPYTSRREMHPGRSVESGGGNMAGQA